ncbi:MAG: type II secretion system protein GspD [Deltaproteobacteria bacterium RIFOXYD12_FULL_57_12]|nr:MAG: type II secretion system protein GspD [Deltaproteobacteria bacterium RIFOXYD12_FULL_57_12]
MNLEEISSQVKKPAQPSSNLDVADKAELPGEGSPKVKDLSDASESENPFLKKLTPQASREVPTQTAGEGILLNFDNADIYEIIQVIGATLGMNYIVDPQVKGVVNIRSGTKIPMAQLPEIFRKILNINGLDIRQEGKYDYIYVAKKFAAGKIYGPEQASNLESSSRVVIQVIPIMNLSAAEAQKLIEPYISDQGSLYNLTATNTLIIADFESNVLDALTLLSRIDISALSSLKIKLIRVENAPLFQLRDELVEIFNALKINKQDYEGVSVVPLERTNSLLLVSSSESLIKSAEKWINELDVVQGQGRDNIYIYNVRNSVASELADLVNSMISENGGSTRPETASTRSKSASARAPQSASSRSPQNPQSPGNEPPAAAPEGAAGLKNRKAIAKEVSSSLHFAGEPTLIPDDSRNVILLRAMPADYTRLMKLLERLDNLPRQVLIEVMVAEVNLDDSWKFGIEWALKDQKLNVNHNTYGQTYQTNFEKVTDAALGGFSYSVVSSTDRLVGLLNALADANDVSILSSPQVLVLNNETATVNVGQQVPVVTSEALNDTTGGTNTRTVQYKDTGIILTVTPRINYNGIIILDIDQQVNDLAKNTSSGIDSPIIITRQLKTKLAVKDGQSIMMGGLIKKKGELNENGIPIAKDIPLFGWLFKYQSQSNNSTELLIMITPYVIESEDVLDQYINKFKEKTNSLREQLTGVKKKEKAPKP